jgi:hypothetical protein
MANTPQSRKARGRKFQQEVIKAIKDKLKIDDGDIENRSMGCGGEDIILSNAARQKFPFSVECKNQQKLNIWDSLKQAEANSGEHIPLLVFRRNHTEAYACLSLDDLLDLIARLNDECMG